MQFYQRNLRFILAVIATTGLLTAETLHADHPGLPELTVSGEQTVGFSASVINPDALPVSTQDSSAMFQQVPGGSLNYNGGVSGQPQYRGMHGPRINVQIDGSYIESGGPNWMDPPLHYLPASLVESIEVTRGIAPVSTGSGIGGYANAKSKTSHYTNSDIMTPHGEVSLAGTDVNGGYHLGSLLGISNNNFRYHFLGAHDQGDDTEYESGTIAGSSYEKTFFGFGLGYRENNNEFIFDVRRTDTDNSGNPVLPLDISFFKTNQLNTAFKTKMNAYDVEAKFFVSDISHQMNNFSLRPAPDFSALPLGPFLGDDKRAVDVESGGFGWSLVASRTLGNGTLKFGTDGKMNQTDATVSDPDFAMFFITNFNDAEANHYGVFTEWSGELAPKTNLEAGLRVEHVDSDSGFVNAFPAVLADTGAVVNGVTLAAQDLRNRYNTSDLSQTDTNVDAVIKINHKMTNSLDLEVAVARKTRSASYIEKYLWIPLEINAGLGDGNNYVGDPGLDPEISYQIELGLNFDNNQIYFSPRVYYKNIDDYIQGIASIDASAITFSALAAGDSTPLVFSNIDAKIYGLDAAYGFEFDSHWRVDGTIAYTRGERRDIDDALYRIAPLNTSLSLSYQTNHWSTMIETVAFAEQDKISNTLTLDPANPNNNNSATGGYALLNLYGQYSFASQGLHLQAGIENLLDKQYTDHLSGFNRNSASVVPVGQRLSGAGRNVFANLVYRW